MSLKYTLMSHKIFGSGSFNGIGKMKLLLEVGFVGLPKEDILLKVGVQSRKSRRAHCTTILEVQTRIRSHGDLTQTLNLRADEIMKGE